MSEQRVGDVEQDAGNFREVLCHGRDDGDDFGMMQGNGRVEVERRKRRLTDSHADASGDGSPTDRNGEPLVLVFHEDFDV
jgi:hypothetical protein